MYSKQIHEYDKNVHEILENIEKLKKIASLWSMRFVFKDLNIPLRETMASVSCSDKLIA